MSRILTMALKDLRLLMRDKFGLFWVVAFPLIMALFFGSIFSGGSSDSREAMKIAFVGDGSESATTFRANLANSDVVDLQDMSADSAHDAVANGKIVAYVKYEDTASSGMGFFAGAKPNIEVGIDPSRRAESGYIQGLVNQAYFQALQQTMMNPDRMHTSIANTRKLLDSATGLSNKERSTYLNFLSSLDTFMTNLNDTAGGSSTSAREEKNSPFSEPNITYVDVAKMQTGPRSSWEITFPQALQWALIGCAAAFAISLVIERTRGTLLRLRLAPITRAHILAGKGLACFVACFSVCAVLLAVGVFMFGVHVASLGHLILALVGAAVCFVGLMMLISVLGKTEQSVAGAGWAILLVISMTGGGMIPLFFMPKWMRFLSDISPVKWSVLAMEGAIWRGFTLSQMLLPVGILIAVGVVSFSVGVTVMVRTDR